MKLWHELKNMGIPVMEVGAIVSIAVVGAIWANDLDNAQTKTQDQLDQLVTIVAETTKENAQVHKENAQVHKNQGKSLTSIEKSLELLALEVKLRRELEKERNDAAANTH